MTKVLIIGNSAAGMTAANEIRHLRPDFEISILSRESEHFFSRTALMYEFCGQLNRKDLEPFERNHYQEMSFNRVNGEAVHLDPNQQKVKLADGKILEYDLLLLACGSEPLTIPWQRKEHLNVGHFVTLEHLEWLKENAKKCLRGKKQATVVGGGLIGIELAEILNDFGLNVSFLIREEWFWPIALNKAESNFVKSHMESHGIKVLLETETESIIEDNNKIAGFNLSNGEQLSSDLVMVCIGVKPATRWLQGSELVLSDDRFKAIETNDYLQTNFENIYSAGDCANVTWFNGIRRPEQLWYTARDQGLTAGRNIAGNKENYSRGALYNSAKLFDIEYTTAGLVNFPLENITEWYQDIPDKYYSQRIILQNEKVIGFNMLGSRWNHEFFLRWIQEERGLDYVLQHLDQARFDAEFTPKFKILNTAKTYAI